MASRPDEAENERKEAKKQRYQAERRRDEAEQNRNEAKKRRDEAAQSVEQAEAEGQEEKVLKTKKDLAKAEDDFEFARECFNAAVKREDASQKVEQFWLEECRQLGAQVAKASPVVMSLAEAADAALVTLKRRFALFKAFNYSDEQTDQMSGSAKQTVKREVGNECVVCSGEPASIAHLLKSRKQCINAGVKWDSSNFISLCGSFGDIGTCHHAFDSHKMSFMHVGGEDKSQWMVVGGEHHGKQVTIKSKPHRNVMHGHLVHCMITEALEVSRWELPNDAQFTHTPPSASNGGSVASGFSD